MLILATSQVITRNVLHRLKKTAAWPDSQPRVRKKENIFLNFPHSPRFFLIFPSIILHFLPHFCPQLEFESTKRWRNVLGVNWTESGNRHAREATEPFFILTQGKCSQFYIFEHCVHYYARVVHRVLSASSVVSMQSRMWQAQCLTWSINLVFRR